MKKGFSFEEATKKTLNKLEGSFAIVAIHQDYNTIIGARSGSPLVLGINKDEFFIASDVPAFLEYTKDVIYLDDDEIVVINKTYNIYNLKNNTLVNKNNNESDKAFVWFME